jgi:hypothetical protein
MSSNRLQIPLLIALIVLFGSFGCANQASTGDVAIDDTSDDGKIIVPDTTWEETEVPEDSSSGDTGSAVPDTPEGTEGATGADGLIDYTETEVDMGSIDITLMVDGVERDMELPLEVWEGQTLTIEFVVKSEGPELAGYEINTSARVTAPAEGLLDGNEAVVPYTFTYYSEYWEGGGISIYVRNTAGLREIGSVPVMLVPFPGMN